MPIYSGSRYETSLVDYFRKNEGGETYPVIFYEFDELTETSFSIHTYVKGETLQGLSMQFYRRPDLWWVIAEYNPELTDFVNIPSGTEIRIPNV